MKFNKILLITLFLISSVASYCQEEDDKDDSLLDLIESDENRTSEITEIFKTSRIVSLHSVELVDKGEFIFLVGHRFGTLNSGWRNLFGLDNSTIRIGGDFGILENLNAGFGRSSFEKTYDGFLKYRILSQKKGEDAFPFTLVAFTSAHLNTLETPFPNFPNVGGEHRWDYVSELMFASKISDLVSLQLTPMLVHENFVESNTENNTYLAGHIGSSVQITPSTRINAEYFLNSDENRSINNFNNALSIGFDIETGGHIFQVHLTNSTGMTEQFLTETNGEWGDGDIFFGFNITRNFNFFKK